MSGETSITVIGNLTNDPELRFTPAGAAVANFTIASTARTYDAGSKEWKDGETLFLRASIWREAAENAAASLTKGARVIVSGVLKPRTYETKAGEKRTVIELEVEEIGASMRYATVNVNRARPGRTESGGQGDWHPVDDLTISDREYADDDPWFGKDANPEGRVALPGQDRAAAR